jgi:hypothetical protein
VIAARKLAAERDQRRQPTAAVIVPTIIVALAVGVKREDEPLAFDSRRVRAATNEA